MHEIIYDKHHNPGAVYKEAVGDEQFVLVDLFPYKIKEREKFYQRDHPENLEPDTFLWEKYWGEFESKCIEGTWVQDGKTWVFMPPKLFWFINYIKITDEEKNIIQPWLRDIEWIIATYWLCCEGFSGFEKDTKYTCHYLAAKARDGELDEIEQEIIPPSCYNRGKLKQYVDPWTYLTRTYLIDDPRGPLGRPLYSPSKKRKHKENSGVTELLNKKNYLLIGCRGVSKTLQFFPGISFHEYSFSGVKYTEQLDKTARPIDIVLVGPEGDAFQRSLNSIQDFYDSQPGEYVFDKDKVYKGFAYKNKQGSLLDLKNAGIKHLIKEKDNKIVHSGARIQVGTLHEKSIKKLVGGRLSILGIEEVGLVGDFLHDVMSMTYDTMRVSGKVTGIIGMMGTSGDLNHFEAVNDLFLHPSRYNIFGIPNYWENSNKEIGLFISAVYQNRDYEDEQGNIKLKQAFKSYIKKYKSWDADQDAQAAVTLKLNNPIEPRHTLIPNVNSIYNKERVQKQLSHIEQNDLWEKYAIAGSLEYDTFATRGVRFDRDPDTSKVITELNPNFKKINKEGRFVMFEHPRDNIPDYTYWVIVDPTRPASGDGSSLYGLIVYKHHLANGGWLSDGIAGVWKGRYFDLQDNYHQIIKIAKFFGAKIWHENNTGGFTNFCRTNKFLSMLQPSFDPITFKNDPYGKQSTGDYGFRLTKRNKPTGELLFSQWLNEVRKVDEITKIPTRRNVDWVYSKMLLNEVKGHTPSGNFDLLSCGIGLGLLLDSLGEYTPEDPEHIKRLKRKRQKETKRPHIGTLQYGHSEANDFSFENL